MRVKKHDCLCLVLLVILTLISRLSFRSHYLYEWDSVQYALSISDFDIMWHQPHPPGYIFFVLLIRIAHYLVGDPNSSIVALSIGFSVLSVILFYLLCACLFPGQRLALVASFMFLFSPVFWFYGEVATIYAVDAFSTVLIGYLLWKSLLSSDQRELVTGSVVIGFLGGLRQSSVILMAPLWTYALLSRHRKNLKSKASSILGFLVATLSWLIPTVICTGGVENYLAVSRGLMGSGSEKVNALFGGFVNYLLSNVFNFSVWILQGISPVGILLIMLATLYLLKERGCRNIVRNKKVHFFALWIGPAFLFHLVFYTEKPGYLLDLIPPVLLLVSWAIAKITSKVGRGKRQMVFQNCLFAFLTLLFVAWFATPLSKDSIPRKLARPDYLLQPPLSDYNWDVSAREIRLRDFLMSYLEYSVFDREIFTPEQSIICFTGGFPTWRHLMYYYPEYRIYWLVDSTVSGMNDFGSEVYWAQGYYSGSNSGKPFWIKGVRPQTVTISISEDTNSIIWVLHKNTEVYRELVNTRSFSQVINLPSDGVIFVTRGDFNDLRLGNFIIHKSSTVGYLDCLESSFILP